jgi:hypothetical protein
VTLSVAPAFFPDPLLETVPYALPANRTDAIWLTVYAPASTKPGVYRGELRVDTGSPQEFRIEVVDATVPTQQTLLVTNWFNSSAQHLARFYKLSGEDDNYWQLLGNIAPSRPPTGR